MVVSVRGVAYSGEKSPGYIAEIHGKGTSWIEQTPLFSIPVYHISLPQGFGISTVSNARGSEKWITLRSSASTISSNEQDSQRRAIFLLSCSSAVMTHSQFMTFCSEFYFTHVEQRGEPNVRESIPLKGSEHFLINVLKA